jgi:hypothetical protein
MKKRALFFLAVMAVSVLSIGATCNPPPPIPPAPDATDAAPTPTADAAPAPATDAPTPGAKCPDWTAACQALAAANCQIGTYPDCPVFMGRDFGSGKVENKATGKPLTCADIAAVHTKAEAQRLGFVCP